MLGWALAHWQYIALLLPLLGAMVAITLYAPPFAKSWLYCAAIIIGMSVLGNMLWSDLKKDLIQQGETQCQQRVDAAKAKATLDAQRKIDQLQKDSQEVENEILQDRSDDRLVSGVLRRQLERMRSNRQTERKPVHQ